MVTEDTISRNQSLSMQDATLFGSTCQMTFHFIRRDWIRTRTASWAWRLLGASPPDALLLVVHLMSRRSTARDSLLTGSPRSGAGSTERVTLVKHAPRIKYLDATLGRHGLESGHRRRWHVHGSRRGERRGRSRPPRESSDDARRSIGRGGGGA